MSQYPAQVSSKFGLNDSDVTEIVANVFCHFPWCKWGCFNSIFSSSDVCMKGMTFGRSVDYHHIHEIVKQLTMFLCRH